MTAEYASAFFVTGGTLRPDAPCYVERQADHDLFEALLKGEFCYVLTSRQMGKSSLMVRAAVKLREHGVHVVVLDLSAIGQNVDAEQWHNGLLAGIGRQLRLENEVEDFWNSHRHLTPMQRLMAALRDVALTRCQGAIVLFVDELDVVRSLPFKTDEFFATVRACANQRAEDAEFRRLTFCLLGVATPSDLIQDPHITPFNIGRRIELHDFTGGEAAPLAKGLEDAARQPAAAFAALQRILYWTSGHPYLTQRLCKAVASRADAKAPAVERRMSSLVDELCTELFLTERARERDDNLVFVRERILRLGSERAALLHFYERVLSRPGAPDDETSPLVATLGLAGIVRRDVDRLRPRNRIYARAFDRRWIEANMPDAEKRRQKEAYRRGVMRTATVAAAVVFLMAGLAGLALRSRTQARNATWTALRDQARLSRLSAQPGQRFGALESLQQANQIRPSPELRDEAIACLAWPDIRPQPGFHLSVTNALALVLSADLKSYALATATGEIVLRAVEGNRELARWQARTEPPARIWIAPDGRSVMLAHAVHEGIALSYWRVSPSEQQFAVTNRMHLGALDFSPDGSQVAIGCEDGTLRVFSLPDGKLHTEADLGHPCSGIGYAPQGRRLAAMSSESLLLGIYSASSGELERTLHSASPASLVAWHPDGRLLAAAGEDRRVRIWEVDADEAAEFPRQELPSQAADITALAFSRSGGLLASASADGTIRLWEPGNARLLLASRVSGSVPQLSFSPEERQLGFVLAGREISLWEIATGNECRALFDFEADDLSAVDIHPNGRLLATAHRNGITLWDLKRSRMVARMPVGATAAVRFRPGTGDLVTGELRGTYWFQSENVTQGNEQWLRLKPKEDFYLGPAAKALDFARDSDVLAVAYDDRVRLVRNTNSAYAALSEWVGEPGFGSVAISPDGQLVAAGNWKSGEVWLWQRGEEKRPRRWNVEGRARVRFSPDGRWLATGTEKLIVLWEPRTQQAVVRVERPLGATRPAALDFTKDGKAWAVAWSDTRVRMLDLNGRTIADFPPHQQTLVGLAFTPDGSRLVCATAARTVLVWNLGAVADELTRLSLDNGFKLAKAAATPVSDLRSLSVEVGAFDRLRFSQVLSLRRELGDLTDKLRREPGATHLYQYRAERYRAVGEYDKAIADYLEWIRLDQAASPLKNAKDRAWPLRDLAWLYISGPPGVQNFEKARALTQEALKLDAENADNHFRHGLACYRLGRIEEAERSLDAARKAWVAKNKPVTVVLFYQAMCQARQKNRALATQLLQLARQDYAQRDLKYRENHVEELADLVWEAERVVGELEPGG